MRKLFFFAFVVSLGGFLFGFDAGIISGVMSYAGPQFNLSDWQTGWVVSSPSLVAMFAMVIAGRLSNFFGRIRILKIAALLYTLSALLSTFSISFEMLYLARMLGGLAFGAALVLVPTYIAEISTAKNRGKLVSVQQLNIVLGFFAAFLSNYYFNEAYASGNHVFLTELNIWRWMLGVEVIPAVVYLTILFFVPKSPRWLFSNQKNTVAKEVLIRIHGFEIAKQESITILKRISNDKLNTKAKLKDLWKPSLKFVLTIGLVLGILQQITGINAVYFYATSIFKQTGIGTNAAFFSGVLLSFTTVVFTIIAMFLIDKIGRRPLLLVGMAGISLSLLLCAYGFYQATYELSVKDVMQLKHENKINLEQFAGKVFQKDTAFKNEMKTALSSQVYALNEGAILEVATNINAKLVLIGILGFIACFAFSLGPVMWVMLSELYPNRYRGLAIGVIGFVNGFVSWLVQQIFPWELSKFGSAFSFFVFGIIAFVGFFILLKLLPETKGRSLEQIEADLIN